MRDTRAMIAVVAATLVLASCSGSSSETSVAAASSTTQTVAATTTTAPATTTTVPLVVEELPETVEALGIVSTTGAFSDPDDASDLAGGGIATVVDPSGLAITTARAVVGAEAIEVRMAGTSEPISASLIAHDECANLALIDLDGDGYRYLELEVGATPGTTVYALHLDDAGTFALREGIVETVDGGGTSAWASIDSMIEHTAVPPGTSGAPLVDRDARLIGVSHLPATNGAERAIPAGMAEQLLTSRETFGLGLNGVSVKGPYENGTWVSAIVAGSPMTALGVEPGDVIVSIDGVEMAPGGGRAAFCSVVPIAETGSVTVEVLRSDPPRRLVGTLHSGAALEADFQLERALAYLLPSTTEPAYTFSQITSDDGLLTMEVPTAFADVTTDGSWGDPDADEPAWGSYILATTDSEAFLRNRGTRGTWLSRSDTINEGLERFEWLESQSWSACTKYGEYGFASGPFAGRYSLWYGCGESGSVIVGAEVYGGQASELIYLHAELEDQRDIAALVKMWATFDVLTEP